MTRVRPRTRILLTDIELRRLDDAVLETGALSRSLIVQEAVQAGLRNPDLSEAQRRRCRRVDVRIPERLTDRVEQLARTHGLTKQSLLRHFLRQYLTSLQTSPAAPGLSFENNPESHRR